MRPHLGYYAHHHGSGHVRRAQQILALSRVEHTLLTSSPRAVGANLVRLPLDSGGPMLDRPVPAPLHYAPLGHRGLRVRTAMLAAWFAEADPALLVVDVSVEVTLLARLAGVAPVVVRQPGCRTDVAHRTAYEVAHDVLAFWPAWAEDPATERWLCDLTTYVGGTSRFEGRRLPRTVACARAGLDPADRHVVVIGGFGGEGFESAEVQSAARATPDHRWILLGPAGTPGAEQRHPQVDVRGVVEDPQALLSAADVVVTHAGQNAVMDAAAMGSRLIIIPRERPFGEQVAFARSLAAHDCAVVRERWPTPDEWPAILRAAQDTDQVRLRSLVDRGAAVAAHRLDQLTLDLAGGVPI